MHKCIAPILTVVVALFLTGLMTPNVVKGASKEGYANARTQNLVGTLRRHVIQKEETLLDLARLYDLGFNEIEDLYPDYDPWLPPAGFEVDIPSQWIVPETISDGILVNTAELRLYYFDKQNNTVMTFPVGIGDRKLATPDGVYKISRRIVRPSWTIPPSLRDKYPVNIIPPGPDNPLGEYWLGLDDTSYGIHGTNFPWSIGRTASRGCLRMYPEDIQLLFKLVEKGTAVKIIYEPVKIIKQSGRVFVEIHRDIYGRIGHLFNYAHCRLHEYGVASLVNFEKFHQAIERQDGMPVDITRSLLLSHN